ncbi:YncE family protein [Micromonospora sp. NPDC050784]|uniref:YncE family protein n=1 Tax=Micromonospora sp. NPDC050784 TaxID=3364281 RepID=UPI0037A88946
MRFRTVIGSVLASTIAAAVGLVATTAPAAARDTITLIQGVTGVVDTAAAGGRVFVSANDRIVIADTHGTLTGSITGLASPTGLAVTPDGNRVYVALSGSNEIAEIDAAALTVVRRINLAGYPSPTNLSLDGDQLWVGYGIKNDFVGGILGLDLSLAAPTPVQVANRMYGAPLVAGAGNTVFTAEAGINPASPRVYDVSTIPATLRGVIDGADNDLSNLTDLTITPDGTRAVSVFATAGFDVWDTATLAKVRSYGSRADAPGAPGAIALSPDGAHVATAFYGTSYGPYAEVYNADTGVKTMQAQMIHKGDLVTGSLSVLGDDLYALLNDWPYNRYYLWRVEGAVLPTSTLSLSASTSPTALDPFTITGQLAVPDGSAPGAQPIEITRTLPSGATATLSGVTTAADGSFVVTDTPPVGGSVSYTAVWDGSAAFRWSQTTTTVNVAQHPTSLVVTGPTTANAGKPLTLTGRMSTAGNVPTPAPGSIVVYRVYTNKSGSVGAELPLVPLAADGSFTITDTPPVGGQYTYHVRFDGDATYGYAYTSRDVTIRGAGS